MTQDETITKEWLEERGYEIKSPIFGYEKECGDVTIYVGNYPRNAFCVSFRADEGNGTIITSVKTRSDLEDLERLLYDAFVDYDDTEYIDDLNDELPP